MAPDEVPFDEDEDEEFDADVLAGGGDEDDERAHAQESSSDDEPLPSPSPPSPSSKRAYIMFAAAREQDPELAQMPGATRAKKLAQMWRVLSDVEKAEGAARAPFARPIAHPKRGRGRPKKSS
jgi:hypothetical protein